MSQPRYRAAIVGAGAIAAVHAQALLDHADRAAPVAVVDVNAELARHFAARWNIPQVHATLGELLNRERIDLVHLCTPPATHTPLALQCLDAGANVLVEKPPTLSLAEMDVLAEASRRTGAHVATVFQHRFGTGAHRLREMIAAGELGRPLLATCETRWYRDDEYFRVPWRGKWETEGGGPTMGHGIHQFDLLLSILGAWEQVTAVTARRARDVETEGVSMALVTFADGTLASVVNSVISPRQTSTLRFDFERATVELSHLYGYRDADWTITPVPGHENLTERWNEGRSETVSGHTDQLAAVLDALDAGTAPPVSLPDTRTTMEFIAALYASAAGGRPVRAGEIGPEHPFAAAMNGAGR
jgi:predicted dehydrogenase